jgi:hypothetical protein
MRSLLAATALLVVMGASPSMAREYPICARLAVNNGNPTCDYNTMRQCMATVSGIGGDCIQNPAFAFGQAPQPRLRGKAARAAAARSAQEDAWDNGGWDWNRRW